MTEPTHGPDDLGEGRTPNPMTSRPAQPHATVTGTDQATGQSGMPTEPTTDAPIPTNHTSNGVTTRWHPEPTASATPSNGTDTTPRPHPPTAHTGHRPSRPRRSPPRPSPPQPSPPQLSPPAPAGSRGRSGSSRLDNRWRDPGKPGRSRPGVGRPGVGRPGVGRPSVGRPSVGRFGVAANAMSAEPVSDAVSASPALADLAASAEAKGRPRRPRPRRPRPLPTGPWPRPLTGVGRSVPGSRTGCCLAITAPPTTSRPASSRCGGSTAATHEHRAAGPARCCTTRRWSSTSRAGSARVCPSHVDVADLVQSGIFGLVDAIEKFEPERGLKFETYAMQRIRGAILDDLRSQDWVPRSVRGRARDVERALERLGDQLQRTPTDAEIASELQIGVSDLRELYAQLQLTSVVALDELMVAGRGDASLAETLPDDDRRRPRRQAGRPGQPPPARRGHRAAGRAGPDRGHPVLLREPDPRRDRPGARGDRVPGVPAAHPCRAAAAHQAGRATADPSDARHGAPAHGSSRT